MNFNLQKIQKLGEGSYSKVYETIDPEEEGNHYALKRNLVHSNIDWCCNLRELDILVRLRGHPFILQIDKVFFDNPFSPENPLTPRMSNETKDDNIHFSLELLPMNAKQFFNDIPRDQSYFSRIVILSCQLLLAVEYFHAHGVVHRDLKPSNVLIGEDEEDEEESANNIRLRIADFGMSLNLSQNIPSTPGTVTSWYRAPEVTMEMQYDYKIDLWSVGCIMYEMLSERPLINCREDKQEDIYLSILNCMQREIPENVLRDMWDKTKVCRYNNNWKGNNITRRTWVEQMNISREDIDTFNEITDDRFQEFIEVIDRLLVWNPKERYSATQALNMSFFDIAREYIESMRSRCKAKIYCPIIEILPIKEREWMINVAKHNVFNNRDKLKWYKHRILFHAIDMFERYLVWAKKNPDLIDGAIVNNKVIKIHIDRKDVSLRFFVCLYMMYKYFVSIQDPIFSWKDFVKDTYSEFSNEKYMKEAKKYERMLLESTFSYDIYRLTLAEVIFDRKEIMTDMTACKLLEEYGNINEWKGSMRELLNNFFN